MRRYRLSVIGYRSAAILGLALVAGACNGPRVIHEEPVLRTGERVLPPDGTIQQVKAGAMEREALLTRERDSIAVIAASGCAPQICTALARGEMMLGMNLAQVMAATRTTAHAWTIRESGATTVLVPQSLAVMPHDVVGAVAMVQLGGDRVTSFAYREAQGLRVVDAPADATDAARVAARATALVREGDDLMAAGSSDAALDRYDRALVLMPNNAALQYKTATILDQRLRPVEALMRYQRFLHQMEIEKIQAQGEANAKMAEAIARARERVIVLEKQTR